MPMATKKGRSIVGKLAPTGLAIGGGALGFMLGGPAGAGIGASLGQGAGQLATSSGRRNFDPLHMLNAGMIGFGGGMGLSTMAPGMFGAGAQFGPSSNLFGLGGNILPGMPGGPMGPPAPGGGGGLFSNLFGGGGGAGGSNPLSSLFGGAGGGGGLLGNGGLMNLLGLGAGIYGSGKAASAETNRINDLIAQYGGERSDAINRFEGMQGDLRSKIGGLDANYDMLSKVYGNPYGEAFKREAELATRSLRGAQADRGLYRSPSSAFQEAELKADLAGRAEQLTFDRMSDILRSRASMAMAPYNFYSQANPYSNFNTAQFAAGVQSPVADPWADVAGAAAQGLFS